MGWRDETLTMGFEAIFSKLTWLAIVVGLASPAHAHLKGSDQVRPDAGCLGERIQLLSEYQRILPSIPGALDNIPRSLAQIPENRILYGIEGEYGVEESMKGVIWYKGV